MEIIMQVQSSSYGVGFGCGDFQFTTEDKNVLCARSMEFPIPMESKRVCFNRDTKFTSKAPDNSPGFEWVSKYGIIGINAFDLEECIVEGTNGWMSFGFLTLGCSEYQTVEPSQYHQALTLLDVGVWMLGCFQTVEEVKEALPSVRIWGQVLPILQEMPKLHIALHDSTGQNLVIEFIKGKVKLHDNPVGVLTNDPPFRDQLINLQQYNYLSPEMAENAEINGYTLQSPGIGGRMKGLPGDWTPETRFIRLATAVRFALQPKTIEEGIVLATHILNMVDIPEGLVGANLMHHKTFETTRWCSIKKLGSDNPLFIYRSYNDMALRVVYLAQVNFAAGTQHHAVYIQAEHPTLIPVNDL